MTDNRDDRKAFRLCIAADDRDRLLDTSAWPDSIRISDWYFKPRDPDDRDKRIRVDRASLIVTSKPRQEREEQSSSAACQQSPRSTVIPPAAASASAASTAEDSDSTIMEVNDGC